eukprot:m.259749 g.259749  ORF g.259749 m.259749 type:complete len:252 (+) comp17589_c0_seq6:6463-7218(+)
MTFTLDPNATAAPPQDDDLITFLNGLHTYMGFEENYDRCLLNAPPEHETLHSPMLGYNPLVPQHHQPTTRNTNHCTPPKASRHHRPSSHSSWQQTRGQTRKVGCPKKTRDFSEVLLQAACLGPARRHISCYIKSIAQETSPIQVKRYIELVLKEYSKQRKLESDCIAQQKRALLLKLAKATDTKTRELCQSQLQRRAQVYAEMKEITALTNDNRKDLTTAVNTILARTGFQSQDQPASKALKASRASSFPR